MNFKMVACVARHEDTCAKWIMNQSMNGFLKVSNILVLDNEIVFNAY